MSARIDGNAHGCYADRVKLYTSDRAPNPRRVHVFLAEKGAEIETHVVSLRGEQFTPEYKAIHPDSVVPALVLDDGTPLIESVAICQYLDEVLDGPTLFGRDPRERAFVQMWIRQLEIQLYLPVQNAYRNSREGFAGSALPGTRGEVPQIAELVPRSNATYRRMMAKLDRQLETHPFVVGEAFTMADVVALTTIDFAKRTKMEAGASLDPWPAVARWHAEVSARPSASAGVPGS